MTAETAAPAPLAFRSLTAQLPIMLVSLAHGSTHRVVATFYLLLPSLSSSLGLNYTETGFLVIAVFYFLAASVLLANLLCLTIPKTEHGA